MSTTIFADIIDRHLTAFPHLTAVERGIVHVAFEQAPREPISTDDGCYDAYLTTPAAIAWNAIRHLPLNTPRTAGAYCGAYALTLDEIAGGESAPTQQEIMVILSRAADILDGIS